MIDFNNLKFGDTVYVSKEVNNAFRKKRISFTDSAGIEWYRYDLPNWEYSVEELVYCGKTTYVEEGEVRFDEDRQTELHFKYPDGQICPVYLEDDFENWFASKAEAEDYNKKLTTSKEF